MNWAEARAFIIGCLAATTSAQAASHMKIWYAVYFGLFSIYWFVLAALREKRK